MRSQKHENIIRSNYNLFIHPVTLPANHTPVLKTKYSRNTLIVGLLSIILISFAAFKSYNTSFTHDESLSYNNYVFTSFMDIVSYADPYTNNHILNTLMMKWSQAIFGDGELALRLHSVLALAGYLFFCYQLLKELAGKLLFSGFLLLVANPYLLDYFSLARGYGISICFMTGSVWFATRWLKRKTLTDLAAFNFMAFLAVFSNFSLVTFYLCALAAINLVQLLQSRHTSSTTAKGSKTLFIQSSVVNLLFLTGATLAVWEPIRKIMKLHMLDFGGKLGLIPDTFGTLISASFYFIKVPSFIIIAISWLAALATVVTVFLWIRNLVVRKGIALSDNFYAFVFINCTLMFILLFTIAQHYILGNDYLMRRFALFLYPLFILNVLYAFNVLNTNHDRVAYRLVPGVLSTLFLLNFLYNVTPSDYIDWDSEADTHKAITQLTAYHNTHDNGKKVRVGVLWTLEPVVNFYRKTRKLDWLEKADRDDLKKTDDYFLAKERQIQQVLPNHGPAIFTARSGVILLPNPQ